MPCRNDSSPLQQGSFEETVDIFFRYVFAIAHIHSLLCPTDRPCRASTYAEVDRLAGVTENVIIGRLAGMGTGSFSLHLDLDGLEGCMEQQEAIRAESPPAMLIPEFRSPFLPSFSSPAPSHDPYVPSSPTYVPPEYSAASPTYEPCPEYSASSPVYDPVGGRSMVYSPSHPGIDFQIGFDDDYNPEEAGMEEYKI